MLFHVSYVLQNPYMLLHVNAVNVKQIITGYPSEPLQSPEVPAHSGDINNNTINITQGHKYLPTSQT